MAQQRQRMGFVGCIVRSLTLPWLVLLASLCSPAQAAALPYDVPPALSPWVEWVAAKHPQLACPLQANSSVRADCTWVNQLSLTITPTGLDFVMQVQAFAPALVILPGDTKLWPVAVRVDNAPMPVLSSKSRPALSLAPGRYQVRGQIPFARVPNNLTLPPQFGLLSVVRDGQQIMRPSINGSRLFLGKRRTASTVVKASGLKVEVFRHLEDSAPMRLTTYLRLQVAGTPRIESLGRLLPNGFEVTHINSRLPARLLNDGTIQVQVQPGEHLLTVSSRALSQPAELGFDRATDNWPAQEIWAFAPHRELRLVSVGGADGIDLSQVNAPFDVSGLQGFVLTPDQQLQLTEQQRGDPNPLPGQMQMQREIWLNFDGTGFVVRDDLQAQLRRGTRLSATYGLGSVQVDGTAQLVTTVAGDEPGVQLDPGSHQVVAVSAVPRAELTTAVGWKMDADEMSATLHIPPGWRLLWTRGVDSAPQAWLARWTLWDLFLVILSLVLAWRYLGLGFTGLLAGTLLVAYQQSAGFAVVWLLLLFVLVVLPHLTHARLGRWVRTGALVVAGLTLFSALGLAVEHVRQGIYPQLAGGQGPQQSFELSTAESDSFTDSVAGMEIAAGAAKSRSSVQRLESRIEEIAVSKPRAVYPEGLQVQTGPGQPNWRWQQARLNWYGPVVADQPIALTLMPPLFVRLWHLLVAASVLLVSGLLLLVLLPQRLSLPSWLQTLAPHSGRTVILMLSGLILVSAPVDSTQATTPSPELLEELEARLLQPPPCAPGCATISNTQINVTQHQLTITLEVHAATLVSLPLPGSVKGWLPTSVNIGSVGSLGTPKSQDTAVVSGSSKPAFNIAVPAGVHLVTMRGPLAQLDQVVLTFPIKPARVVVDGHSSWQVSGLQNQRLLRDSLTLQRKVDVSVPKEEAAQRLQPNVALPYVRIERHIDFNLDWRVTTKVVRIAPRQGSFTIRVPLLKDEAVLDDKVAIDDDQGQAQARLVFGARQSERRWQSRLPVDQALALVAGDIAKYQEVWSFRGSNLWHLSFQPSAGLVASTVAGRNGPVFYPRSGETLSVLAQASEPVPGASMTVHGAELAVQPGERVATNTLRLRIQSSQGGEFPVQLPVGSQLTEVTIDGSAVPLSLRDHNIDLPLVTGFANYAVQWRAPQPQQLRYQTASVGVPGELTNITLTMELPRDRWLLAIGGPSLGPALLFWGVFVVVALVGYLITRIPGSALRPLDALLLALGLTLCNFPTVILVALWVLALQFRGRLVERLDNYRLRNLVQVLTAGLTVITVLALIASVPMALLGSPDMQVTGNHSSAYFFRWYADQAVDALPQAWVVSLPLWVYRGAMLLWSLWLAFALLRWLRWSWSAWAKPQPWYASASNVATNPTAQSAVGPEDREGV